MGTSLSVAAVQEKQRLLESSDISKSRDRISELPEVLLSQIISYLPTKNAVQTSVLSKRWKNIWLFAKSFEFEMHLQREYKGDKQYIDSYENRTLMSSFANSVARLLVFHDKLNIEKFRYSGLITPEFPCSHLYALVSALLMSKVQNVALELSSCRNELSCELPRCLFTCKTLVVLKLDGEFLLDVPFYVSLPSLKTLHLKSIIYLDDSSTQRFLSSCPIIEDLTIERPQWDNAFSFKISLPTLKRLTYIFMHGNFNKIKFYDYEVVVNTPSLEYLKLVGYAMEYISLADLPLLVEADICIQECYGYMGCTYKVIRASSRVERLSLSGYTLQAVKGLLENLRSLPKFQNLIQLKFGSDPRNGPILLPYFLERSPNLEILLIPEGISNPEKRIFNVGSLSKCKYVWETPGEVPECLLLSLKRIEIHRFYGDEEEMKTVLYLLRKAMVLEKMTIFCDYLADYDSVMDSYPFAKKVLEHPRGSKACKVSIQIPSGLGRNLGPGWMIHFQD